MIVPRFWAEGRISKRDKKGQVTVRRFGWSDESQEAAQGRADLRAREAFDRITSGESLPRVEPKRAYNGAEGVPIREEIVARHGETIITRNAYGALCLNTPNVLFADVDLQEGFFRRLLRLTLGVLLRPVAPGLAEDAEARARGRIGRFVTANPGWSLRVYRTPAGFRLLAMHRTFAPSEPAVSELFEAIGTDRIYARMCVRQQCFRARVSPKPWRIGIGDHIKPPRGVWPVQPAQIPGRERWIRDYERAAKGFAACRFEGTVGGRGEDPAAVAVQRLHDDLCQAERALSLA